MTAHLPFFSVIIPTYGRPDALTQCVDAFSRLDYPASRFELIIVDDGGSVPLAPRLKAFDGRLRITVLWQPNAGPAAARNFGASHASGEFLAFTDDDCRPCSQWLTAFGSAFACTPDALAGGKTCNALQSNPYAETSQLILDVVYDHYNSSPLDAQFFASNNMAVSASTFRAVGGFDPRFRTSEDRDVCDRVRSRGFGLRYVSDAVIYHAHALTLRSFWKQHAGYGRGAWLYHSARAQRGSGTFKVDWSFYRSLVCAPLRNRKISKAAQGLSLLFVAQVANAIGYATQGLKKELVSKAEGQ